MPVYVKSGGTWRETSQLYVRDGTSYTNKTVLNGYIKQSGTYGKSSILYLILLQVLQQQELEPQTLMFLLMPMLFKYKQAVGGGGGG